MSWESVLAIEQLDVRQEHLWARSADGCLGVDHEQDVKDFGTSPRSHVLPA